MNEQQNLKRISVQRGESDTELGIILDARRISEIETQQALLDISQRIADKKRILLDIDKQLDDVSNTVTLKEDHQSSLMELEQGFSTPFVSSGVECPPDRSASKHPRVGDTRILSPNDDYGITRK